jgi:replication-associated recombination protein RarA
MVPLNDNATPDEVVGQAHLIGEGKILRRLIEADRLTSAIFWGPPGTGKTTLAQVIAQTTQSRFVFFSAVLNGIKEVREIVAKAREERRYHGRKTLLFVDEIHRFNKAQQDAFLPYVERGEISLIGATTENPPLRSTLPSFPAHGSLSSNPSPTARSVASSNVPLSTRAASATGSWR